MSSYADLRSLIHFINKHRAFIGRYHGQRHNCNWNLKKFTPQTSDVGAESETADAEKLVTSDRQTLSLSSAEAVNKRALNGIR